MFKRLIQQALQKPQVLRFATERDAYNVRSFLYRQRRIFDLTGDFEIANFRKCENGEYEFTIQAKYAAQIAKVVNQHEAFSSVIAEALKDVPDDSVQSPVKEDDSGMEAAISRLYSTAETKEDSNNGKD